MSPVKAAFLSLAMLAAIAVCGVGIYAADASTGHAVVDGYGVVSPRAEPRFAFVQERTLIQVRPIRLTRMMCLSLPSTTRADSTPDLNAPVSTLTRLARISGSGAGVCPCTTTLGAGP